MGTRTMRPFSEPFRTGGSVEGNAPKGMEMAMKKVLLSAGALAFAVVAGAPAYAQAPRTWVSGAGDDANQCSRLFPCKTFATAMNATAALGEINCLDSAGFGTVTITKQLTIDCTGALGGITNP